VRPFLDQGTTGRGERADIHILESRGEGGVDAQVAVEDDLRKRS
jgi:hypothetical protein